MTPASIDTAIHEANRFLTAAKAWKDKEKSLEIAFQTKKKAAHSGGSNYYIYRGEANVEHAALKRASLDLTRSLARMRRPS